MFIEVVSVSNPAIFLDRDGVINEDTGYVSQVDDFHFLPGVIDALQLLKKKGGPTIRYREKAVAQRQ